jgi:predicted RNase H-like nuclease (RuvC/YqgF family)
MALRDDNINATLNINGSPARAEMTKLSEDTDRLRQRNRELELGMKKLEAQGKKDTEVYRQYSQELQQNQRTIQGNNRRQRELNQSLQLTEKTVAELRREARQLRLQLDNMIPDDPRRRQLEEQPGAITGRMRELQGASNQVSGSLKTVSVAMLAVIALKVAEKLKEWVGAAIEFTKKGIEMARSTQGIRLSFNRFAGSDDLKKLRVETKVLCLPPNFFH